MIGLLVVLLLTFSRAKYCVRVSVTLLIQQQKKKYVKKSVDTLDINKPVYKRNQKA